MSERGAVSPKLWLPLAVLAAGAAAFTVLVKTGPEVEPRAAERLAPLVRVVDVLPQTLQLSVRTHGTVAPRTEADLVPEVSGRVVWVAPSLVSGGFFGEGELLLRLDDRDYRAAVARARAALQQRTSEAELAAKELERRQRLAKREFASAAQLDSALNADRVSAAAAISARAALDQAKRDLERTAIRATFSGRVREESVDPGQFVNRGTRIAVLYAVDYAEVRLPIPDEELAYLDLPLAYREEPAPENGGPAVRLHARFAGAEHTWDARVVRTEGEIDPRSRMVHAVARVDDPYGRAGQSGRPPLAVGLFVEAEILGREVRDVTVLPRAALRAGDRVLVLDGDDRLRFRSVDVLRIDREQVVLRGGVDRGERVCVSPLESAVDGMKVRAIAPAQVRGRGA